MLGEELDKSVQVYLRKVRECGGVVTSRIAVAAARGIIMIDQCWQNLVGMCSSTCPGVTPY